MRSAAEPRSVANGATGFRHHALGALCFVLPAAIYVVTASASVQFDDAAELALCAREWSNAHPPGYPLWTTLAHVWLRVSGPASSASALAGLSALFGAAAIATLYYGLFGLFSRLSPPRAAMARAQAAAVAGALCVAFGASVWQWSNTTEVYSLQLLAHAITLLGLVRNHWLLLGVGLGLGLANHHLSTALLLPFLPWLVGGLHEWRPLAALRALMPAFALATGIALAAYVVLLVRAGAEHRFAFGSPDTLPRLWHHVRGGFYGGGFLQEGVDYGGRAFLYGEQLLRQFGAGLPLVVLGVVLAARSAKPFALALLAHVALVLAVQWARIYTPNMDAAVMPGMALLAVFVSVALVRWKSGWIWASAVILATTQFALNLPAADRSGYRAGAAVLEDLSHSAPPRSVLLLTSWEMQTLARLAIEELGWRTDLVVLPSSIKGTDADLLARWYPELHTAIRAEYAAYLAAIAAVDPDWVHTDYFTLSTPELVATYRDLLGAVLRHAAESGRAQLLDRQTVAFLHGAGLVRGEDIHVSGLLFAFGRVPDPAPFPVAPGWLEHPFLQHDLCAYGVLQDYRTASREIAGYARANGLTELARAAASAAARIEAVWREYVRNKPAPRRTD